MEEDDSVHYIYHSALRHLLLDGRESMDAPLPDTQGSAHPRYKFRFDEASTVVAAICVTYLSFPMHDSRLAKRIKVASDQDTMEAVSSSIGQTQEAAAGGSLANKLIARVLDRRKSPVSHSSGTTSGIFNLVNSLAQQEHLDEYETATKQFLEYASRYWLDHTKQFINPPVVGHNLPAAVGDNIGASLVIPDQCYQLFCSLVRSDLAHIRRPWLEDTDIARARWALESGHIALYNVLLYIGFGHGEHTRLATSTQPDNAASLVEAIISHIRSFPSSITLKGKDLGGILALATRFSILNRFDDLKVDALLIENLANFGVDLDAPMRAPDDSLWSPLCLLIREIEWWLNAFGISQIGYVNEDTERYKMAKGHRDMRINSILSLLTHGANPIGSRANMMGGPRPIFMALDLRLWDIALMLLLKTPRADLDFEDECGRTILGLAIVHSDDRAGKGEIFCERLLGAGVDPNIMTGDRPHPRLSYAPYAPANHRTRELRRVYQNQSALGYGETLHSNNLKVPPLVLAARLAYYKIFQMLITAKADIYGTMADGQTIIQVLDEIIKEGAKDVDFLETSHRSKWELWEYWQTVLLEREFAFIDWKDQKS